MKEEKCCGTCGWSGKWESVYPSRCSWPEKHLPPVMIPFAEKYEVEQEDGKNCPVWKKGVKK